MTDLAVRGKSKPAATVEPSLQRVMFAAGSGASAGTPLAHVPTFQVDGGASRDSADIRWRATFGGFRSHPLPRLQVRQFYAVPGPDGAEVNAKLMQATVGNDKALCMLHDPATNKSWIGTFDVTPDELADYAKHPDTYFGVYQRQTRKVETATEMFDFFVDGYRDTPKERLKELLPNYADQEGLHSMSQKELVELLAERYTMSMIAKGFAVKPLRNKRRRPPSK